MIREKKKRVHAFACGTIVQRATTVESSLLMPVGYNPYRAGHFYRKDTGERIDKARMLKLTSEGKVFAVN